MKKLVILLCFFYVKSVFGEITIYLNYWGRDLVETYTTHSDTYLYLENDTNSILSDNLNSVTSLNSVRSGPTGQQTSLFTRGTNSNHTLVTINGSSIRDHSTSNGLTDLGVINTNFADVLHIIKGPMSSLYGADAVGGVIDIQTAKKNTNLLKVGYGSNNKKTIGLSANIEELNNLNFKIFGEETNGISVYPEGSENDGYSFLSFKFGYSGNINNTYFDLVGINSNQDTDLDTSGADDLDYTGSTEFNFIQWSSFTKTSLGKFNLILDYNNWDRKYINGTEVDNYYSNTNHLKLVNLNNNGRINNALGFDVLYYSTDFENRGSFNSSVNKDAQQTGVFNNLDFKLNDNFTVSSGLRFDENSHHGSQSTYRVGSYYKISDLILFGSLASGYKNPTLYEMFGANNFGYTGNPNLSPENSYNKEIGLSINDKLFELAFFDTSIEDMITYGNSTYSNNTSGSSTMQGFDISSQILYKDIYINSSYSHVHAVDSSNVWLKRRPHDIFFTSINYAKDKWWIKPSFSYYGKHSDTHSVNYSTIQVEETSIFDISLGYMNFKMDINNIFDEEYERPHGYNQGGILLNLTYEKNF